MRVRVEKPITICETLQFVSPQIISLESFPNLKKQNWICLKCPLIFLPSGDINLKY